MNFRSTEKPLMLPDTVANCLADHFSFDQRHAALAKEPNWRPEIRGAFTDELSIPGAACSEEQGGLGEATNSIVFWDEAGGARVVEARMHWQAEPMLSERKVGSYSKDSNPRGLEVINLACGISHVLKGE